MSPNATDNVTGSHLAGRVFDLLGYATDIPVNVDDLGNDASQAARLLGFLTRFADIPVPALATVNVQAVANVVNASGNPDRGQEFLGDLLTGFFSTLQGGAGGVNSDHTDISYKVGAIGWPDTGLPGRGLEVALDPTRAFSFLQSVLFDDVLTNTMVNDNKPLAGYISVRICPPTKTLMGMQQYSPYSVMIEVVGYRSPESNVVMDLVQQKVLEQNKNDRLQALLHWGLENQMMTATNLTLTPLQDLVRPTSPFSRLGCVSSCAGVSEARQPAGFRQQLRAASATLTEVQVHRSMSRSARCGTSSRDPKRPQRRGPPQARCGAAR
jgi:hypothetical protein